MLMICPRCYFRLAPGGRICRTCGYVIPAKKQQKGEAPPEQSVVKPALRAWTNLFNFGSPKEKRHDEPALEN